VNEGSEAPGDSPVDELLVKEPFSGQKAAHETSEAAPPPPPALLSTPEAAAGAPSTSGDVSALAPSASQTELAHLQPSPAAEQAARSAAAERATEAACALLSAGNAMADACGRGALGSWLISPASGLPFPTRTAPGTKPSASATDGDVHPAVEHGYSAPRPAPAPGGGGEGSAASGSASASSAFVTTATLLGIAVPHAMRPLRLSQRPWRTSFLVLIPERPD
jgi:hypothetical protein